MALFLSTYVNKVDRKGRVSVPAPFRHALEGQTFHGVVAFPSYRDNALVACGMDFMERLVDSMEDIDLFSDDQDSLSRSLFAESHQLPFDIDGRIMLPSKLLNHANISDQAAFVGQGRTFEIWNPDAVTSEIEGAREKARSEKLSLRLRPRDGGGQ